jgi:hypothetical protein
LGEGSVLRAVEVNKVEVEEADEDADSLIAREEVDDVEGADDIAMKFNVRCD